MAKHMGQGKNAAKKKIVKKQKQGSKAKTKVKTLGKKKATTKKSTNNKTIAKKSAKKATTKNEKTTRGKKLNNFDKKLKKGTKKLAESFSKKSATKKVTKKTTKKKTTKKNKPTKYVTIERFDKQFKAVTKKLEKIETYQQLLSAQTITRTPKAKYPSEQELEDMTTKLGICTKTCMMCSITARNRCWKKVVKKLRIMELIKQIPFTKNGLANLNTRDLMMLCKHFSINPFTLPTRGKGSLVKVIYDKQGEEGLFNEKVSKKGDAKKTKASAKTKSKKKG